MIDLPSGTEPEFVRLRGGKVHLLPPRLTAEGVWRRIGEGPVDPIAVLLGSTTTACGRTINRHVGGLDAAGHLTSTFPDDALCASCYRVVAPESRARLFKHSESA